MRRGVGAAPDDVRGTAVGDVIIGCVDGSELSLAALEHGLGLVKPDAPVLVVCVVPTPDPMLVTGTGMAGGTMSPEEFDRYTDEEHQAGNDAVAAAAARLAPRAVETRVLEGEPAHALVGLAEAEEAAAIVIGSRGRGGFKRAVLGSVSDHVIRHAPCPVIVTGANAEA